MSTQITYLECGMSIRHLCHGGAAKEFVLLLIVDMNNCFTPMLGMYIYLICFNVIAMNVIVKGFDNLKYC